MRITRILLGALLAGGLALTIAAPASARPAAKTPPQITSITARHTTTTLDIVVQTTSVPSKYRVTERVYFYDSSGAALPPCGVITSLHSVAGTRTSATDPYSVAIPTGATSVRVEAELSQLQGRTVNLVDTVHSGLVNIADLPAGWSSMP